MHSDVPIRDPLDKKKWESGLWQHPQTAVLTRLGRPGLGARFATVQQCGVERVMNFAPSLKHSWPPKKEHVTS